jgi:hypothetical protein
VEVLVVEVVVLKHMAALDIQAVVMAAMVLVGPGITTAAMVLVTITAAMLATIPEAVALALTDKLATADPAL